VLDQDYFKEWLLRYEAAKLEVIKLGVNKGKNAAAKFDPNQILIALQNELESELFLLGATALEDKL
jgi:magnesium-transporting ATPase (P-type)